MLFEAPVPLAPSAAAQAEGTSFTELVRTDEAAWGESEPATRPWTRDATTEPAGPLAIAVALERGAGVARDVALRPTRIVVVGDATFVANGALAQRANANRDVFLNSLAWLGMDRARWMRFGVAGAVVLPLVVLALGLVAAFRRGRLS